MKPVRFCAIERTRMGTRREAFGLLYGWQPLKNFLQSTVLRRQVLQRLDRYSTFDACEPFSQRGGSTARIRPNPVVRPPPKPRLLSRINLICTSHR